MQLTRTRKEELVDEMAEKLDEYPVIGILDMHSLPAKQLQEIKKELAGEADIQMSRKTLIALALEKSSRDDIEALKENDAIMPALLFTEKNPFSLYKLIQEKKSSAPASGGEIAPDDIVITEGKTDLDPGPMLGEIQSLGAGTKVEDGKIAVTNDAVAVEAGEVIDMKTADILTKLGMEPLEVGLDLKLVYEDGEVFDRDILAIDADEYLENVETAAAQAFNLAVNAGVMNETTAIPAVRQAFTKARNLAINAGIVVPAVVEDLLRKGVGEARAVEQAVDLDAHRGVSEEEAEEAEEEGEEAEEDTDEDAEDNDGTDGQTDEKDDGGDA